MKSEKMDVIKKCDFLSQLSQQKTPTEISCFTSLYTIFFLLLLRSRSAKSY